MSQWRLTRKQSSLLEAVGKPDEHAHQKSSSDESGSYGTAVRMGAGGTKASSDRTGSTGSAAGPEELSSVTVDESSPKISFRTSLGMLMKRPKSAVPGNGADRRSHLEMPHVFSMGKKAQ